MQRHCALHDDIFKRGRKSHQHASHGSHMTPCSRIGDKWTNSRNEDAMVLTASLSGLGCAHVSHPSTDAMPQTHPQIKHGVPGHLLGEILVVIRGLGRSTWKSRHGGSSLGGLRTTRSLVGETLARRPEVWVWIWVLGHHPPWSPTLSPASPGAFSIPRHPLASVVLHRLWVLVLTI